MTEQQQTTTGQDILANLERRQRESLEHRTSVEKAWASPEARAMKTFIDQDGNVSWPEFVSHCGGILKAVALVDKQGNPDPDRIVPLVDELFGKYAVTQYAGGMTMTRRPNNRPYRSQRSAAPPEFPTDGEPYREEKPATVRQTTARR